MMAEVWRETGVVSKSAMKTGATDGVFEQIATMGSIEISPPGRAGLSIK
ncbi:hypothetical protein O2N63_12900 [Aliiroseovarius sp. KMU-50]|uniref:Uncharacterized protein n=1 Tax=Aliiroseovarius salicola TaxID=3009082 RepID=A0ABT4W588_9RHOB|nr:hypothetical protein [Aliiroseovarius sp. KMU-50]MDA5094982.1 hypothetical protein [Aliiroseovarius sp. KMU-50]